MPASVSRHAPKPDPSKQDQACRLDNSRITFWQRAQHLPDQQRSILWQCYQYAALQHQGQRRRSGIPYITHPMAVASILLDLTQDVEMLQAAILHDVVEDTAATKEIIEQRFGNRVAALVSGVTKLDQITTTSRLEAQANNLQKMVLAMSKDIGVILIKLADRLHNMRTMDAMPLHKKRRITRETLEIYASIANRLGLHDIRMEYENLCFHTLYPKRYRIVCDLIERYRGGTKNHLSNILARLQERLKDEGIPDAEVMGREKTPYSAYKKIRLQHQKKKALARQGLIEKSQKTINFQSIGDIHAFRILVNSADDCYRTLGAVHGLYKPRPGKFKDYIALPKPNGYQSLHTVLIAPQGHPIEIQIRSKAMDQVAECGIAAHSRYKTGNDLHLGRENKVRDWLNQLLELQSQSGTSLEFLEHMRLDLFPDDVFVFSPKGDILSFARGATVLDFAFAIHSDLGLHCDGAFIYGEYHPWSSELSNGMQIDVITRKDQTASPDWLAHIITPRARATLKHALRQQQIGDAEQLGRRLLCSELKHRYQQDLDQFPDNLWRMLLQEWQLDSQQLLLQQIGMGKRPAALTAHRMHALDLEQGGRKRPLLTSFKRLVRKTSTPLTIAGNEGMSVHYAHCCYPIPGDAIIGLMSNERGLSIHTQGCHNIKGAKKDSTPSLAVQWSDPVEKNDFSVAIKLHVHDTKGLLASIALQLSNMDINIEQVTTEQSNRGNTLIHLLITIDNRKHLADVMRRLRTIHHIRNIIRVGDKRRHVKKKNI